MPPTPPYPQTWDLDSLAAHPSSESFRQLMDEYRADLTGLADQADHLSPLEDIDPETVKNWETFLTALEDITTRGTELDAFIGCHAAAAANNREVQQLEAEMSSLGPHRARLALAVQFGLQAASEDQLQELLSASDSLGRISYWLADQRSLALLRLPREQETLAAELDVDGIHAWGRLYDRVSGALRITVMEQGELVDRSPGQVQFDSADRSVRQNNYYSSV